MNKRPYKYDFAIILCPRWGVWLPWPAPAYLIEAVRSHGFSAQYLDYNIRQYAASGLPELWADNKYHQYWKTQPLDHFVNQINLDEIDAKVVGFSLTDTNLRFSIELARRLRKKDPEKTIIFGGHRIFFPEEPDDQVPADACDAIVKGEGELTLLDILHNGLNKNPGTYTPENGRWTYNGDRPLIENLDSFPWPRYEDVNWDLYPGRAAHIMGSRGCINRCNFCNDIVRAQHRFRRRSPEHITDEMLYLKARHGVQSYVFNDPLMNGHYPSFDRQCDILLAKSLNRSWLGNFMIRANMPVDLVRKARQAGLESVILGLESGSSHVLKLMRKRFTPEESEYFIRMLHENHIKVALNLIVGFPGETEDHFQETLRFLRKTAPYVDRIISIATLNVDHSYLWDHPEEFGVVFGHENRHISWRTQDGSNTYEVRADRATRLLQCAAELGLTDARYDGDIEDQACAVSLPEIRARHRRMVARHYAKIALNRVGLFEPLDRLRRLLR